MMDDCADPFSSRLFDHDMRAADKGEAALG